MGSCICHDKEMIEIVEDESENRRPKTYQAFIKRKIMKKLTINLYYDKDYDKEVVL